MDDRWTAAGFVMAYLAIRMIDAILPGGRSFRFLDRWTRKNDEPPKEIESDEP